MTMFRQIVLLIIGVQWLEVNGNPLFQGISFQKKYEINFKPLPRMPISFIKEKWSPFGVFGKKHIIQKRDTEFLMPDSPPPILEHPPAPVFEHIDEIQHVETSPLRFLPLQPPRAVSPAPVPVSPSPPIVISSISPPRISSIPPPVTSPVPPLIIPATPRIISSPAPPPVPLNVIITPTPPPIPLNVNITPVPKPILTNVAGPIVPPLKSAEEEVPLISSNLIVPPPNEAPPPPGLFTDISRSEPVKEYMDNVQPIPPSIAPPVVDNTMKPEAPRPEIVINDNALVRGSKLALYFGSIFLQLMSQFMTNARATFDQMTNPPPVYNK